MKCKLVATLLVTVTCGIAHADDSIAHVLKTHDYFTLAQELGDPSEAGQNEAAKLMAAARRIQTESRIAGKSMRRVIILNGWREMLDRWEDVQLELVYLWSGGGTMYQHMMARNAAETEEFLAGVADNLPLVEKPLTGQATLEIDQLLTKSKQRLAQAKAAVKQRGRKPLPSIADLAQRLEQAHAALKSQFQLAGDDAATKRLLDHCKEPTELWEAP